MVDTHEVHPSLRGSRDYNGNFVLINLAYLAGSSSKKLQFTTHQIVMNRVRGEVFDLFLSTAKLPKNSRGKLRVIQHTGTY